LIFHPEDEQFHVLPRHDIHTYSAGSNLCDVVEWFQESGVLGRPRPFRYFEPLVGPADAANGTGSDWSRLTDAIDTSLAEGALAGPVAGCLLTGGL